MSAPRWLSALLLAGLLLSPARAQSLELVESFPVESDFDQPDLRETQTVWLEMIAAARSEIAWHVFYVAHEPGEASQAVLDALVAAADRGVNVRLLVDTKFRQVYPQTLEQLEQHPRIAVRSSAVGQWYGGVMHAKALFVDGQDGFLGSANLDWRSLDHIREIGLRFRSAELVRPYLETFNWEWEHAGEARPPSAPPSVVSRPVLVEGSRLLATFSPEPLLGPETASDLQEILKLIDGAKQEVSVALHSYSPLNFQGGGYDPTLDLALRRASLRGVKVRLMVSHWKEGETESEHLRSLDELNRTEVRACRIPEASQGEIPFARVHHCKYLVVDGRQAWLGTANWGPDYFHAGRNLGVVMLDGPLPGRLQELFAFDWKRSTALAR